MSLIANTIVAAAGRLSDHKIIGKLPWLRSGVKGLVGVSSFGLGAGKAYYSYGNQYGSGVAAMYGLASISPYTGIPLFVLDSSRNLLNDMHKSLQQKRVSSFSSGPKSDKFGTIQKMRQFSGQQMRKDHSASARVFGNEAFYLHR